MKSVTTVRSVITISIVMLMLASGFIFFNYDRDDRGMKILNDDDYKDIETNYIKSSDCVNSNRIACVPKGGGYNIHTGDVNNRSGKVVSTRSERDRSRSSGSGGSSSSSRARAAKIIAETLARQKAFAQKQASEAAARKLQEARANTERLKIARRATLLLNKGAREKTKSSRNKAGDQLRINEIRLKG